MDKCRKKILTWGAINRVSFGPVKEHVVILHPIVGHGKSFKLLGCMIDTDLRMHSCMEQLLSKIRPKIPAIPRSRDYYSVPIWSRNSRPISGDWLKWTWEAISTRVHLCLISLIMHRIALCARSVFRLSKPSLNSILRHRSSAPI